MNILVLMGGMSAEREVSLNTGEAVRGALESAGHKVSAYDLEPAHGRDIMSLVTLPALREAEVIFITLHGGEGEDGRIQALLELLGVPYTGSGVRASAVCMDKALTKMVFEHYGIATPAWFLLTRPRVTAESARQGITGIGGLPVVTKPVDQGSTIGISIVRDPGDLPAAIDLALTYSSGVLFEKYIDGRELSVPVVGDEVFPIVEIRPKEGFYDYKRKYTKGLTEYDCPAPVSGAICDRIREDAIRAFTVTGCEGFARVDLRLGNDGVPYFLEINTIPGMTETSLVPMAAAAMGLSFPELIDRIARLALRRAEVRNPKCGG